MVGRLLRSQISTNTAYVHDWEQLAKPPLFSKGLKKH
jgi:hypothetical protein